MTPAERTDWLCARARAAGFDLCGVAPVTGFPELQKFPEWLALGYAGEMRYLEDARRRDVQTLMTGARSLLVVALNYNSSPPYSASRPPIHTEDAPRGWISRYAWGDDYHDVIKRKLDALVAEMQAQFAQTFEARSYVDTGPILERVAAKYAGLGWLAKNTCLINQRLGSWLFLGVIVTTLELEPTLAAAATPPADLCGTCTRCLEACPTQAFPEPYVLDARRCISYLTIELRGSIPEELRAPMGDAAFGCDICQDVCPWNRKAPVTALPAFQPRTWSPAGEASAAQESLLNPRLDWLASLTRDEFNLLFRKSSAKRAKWRGVVRNACVALGNSRLPAGSEANRRALAILEKLAASDDPVISEHARWALAQLSAAARAPSNSHTTSADRNL